MDEKTRFYTLAKGRKSDFPKITLSHPNHKYYAVHVLNVFNRLTASMFRVVDVPENDRICLSLTRVAAIYVRKMAAKARDSPSDSGKTGSTKETTSTPGRPVFFDQSVCTRNTVERC